MKADDEQAFREFVTSQMASLRKLAYLTCGDWHSAEDAVANTLVKLYPSWSGPTCTPRPWSTGPRSTSDAVRGGGNDGSWTPAAKAVRP